MTIAKLMNGTFLSSKSGHYMAELLTSDPDRKSLSSSSSASKRRPLFLALTADGAATWTHSSELDTGNFYVSIDSHLISEGIGVRHP